MLKVIGTPLERMRFHTPFPQRAHRRVVQKLIAGCVLNNDICDHSGFDVNDYLADALPLDVMSSRLMRVIRLWGTNEGSALVYPISPEIKTQIEGLRAKVFLHGSGNRLIRLCANDISRFKDERGLFCSAQLAMNQGALWHCKKCGRDFANRNQSHACGRHDLEHHFEGKRPEIRALFDEVASAVRSLGPIRVLPEKTRIAFQVRMSFAQVTPRAHWLDGHLVLARRLEHPRFRRIQTISPRNHVHFFRLTAPGEIDTEFRAWLAEAYAVGEQRHLKGRTT